MKCVFYSIIDHLSRQSNDVIFLQLSKYDHCVVVNLRAQKGYVLLMLNRPEEASQLYNGVMKNRYII